MKRREVSNPVLDHVAATIFDLFLYLPQRKGSLQGLLPALLPRRDHLKAELLVCA